MTQEEKAKAYDKIIEFAYNKHQFSSNISEIKLIEEMFPELYESEDERIRKEIINYFKCQSRDEPGRKNIHNKWINWLNCIKIESSWDEEDEAYRIDINVAVDSYFDEGYAEELRDWLKSFKDRVLSKNTWKPTKEQMHYLYWISNVKLGDSVVEQEVSKHLNELYKDLKKLKNE